MTAASGPARVRRLPAFVYLMLAVVVTAAGWAFLAPSGRADAGLDPSQVAAGKALFANGCASCHGLAGQGIVGRAPALVGVGGAAVDFQVGSGRMPLAAPGPEAQRHKPRYTQDQIDLLGTYVESLGGGPAKADDSGIAGANLQHGAELFRANCEQCHNFAGAGGALTNGKYAPNLGRATGRQILEAMITGPESMPNFSDAQLTRADKNDIAKFVLSLRHTNDPGGSALGHLGPIPEGLVIWVVGIGGLVAATLWIGAKA